MAELLDENENPQFERLLTSFADIFGAYFIKHDYSSEDPRGARLNLMDTKPEDESVAQRNCLSLCLSAYLPIYHLCCSIYIHLHFLLRTYRLPPSLREQKAACSAFDGRESTHDPARL
jgi:hypothetical protein